MREDRAVSTALGYVLTLSIASLLVTGLLVAGSGFVEDRREQVVREELTVIGQQVGSDLARADRLVLAADSSGGDLTVQLNRTYPDRVTGSPYRIAVDKSSEQVVLAASKPEVTVTVGVTHETPLRDSSADGGNIQLAYDSGDLVISDV
ncbi:hypothetical protein ACFQGE_13805 [Halomicroarcula sp. GCM10025817]|uniref:DUF7266 family protein n=1 Tax=Haloarcula TaxID=2237 RepID=UPI0023E8F0EC|nr:hypothetical protein [Halomicroarcula sp. SYNS111]